MDLGELALKVNKLARSHLEDPDVGPPKNRFGRVIEALTSSKLRHTLAHYKFLEQPIAYNYPYRFTTGGDFDEKTRQEVLPTISCSKPEGLGAIRQKISEYNYETTWIFIPRERLWICDTSTQKWDSCQGDSCLRGFLSYLFPVVELVHTHPDKTLKRQSVEGIRTMNYLIEGACPTTGDLVSMAQQHAQSNQDCRFLGVVVSHHGFATYELSAENIRLRSGGACASCDPRLVNPVESPVDEIKKLLLDQRRRCSMIQCEPDIVPAYELAFFSPR